MVGHYQGPKAHLAPKRFWGSTPPAQKVGVFLGYFWPNWKGGSARFCAGELLRATHFGAVVPGGLKKPQIIVQAETGKQFDLAADQLKAILEKKTGVEKCANPPGPSTWASGLLYQKEYTPKQV